jgi:CHAT domain-containing protein
VALTLPEKLTVYDIVGLPVRADLVTLNGCDSGTGKTLPGAGVLGLARAFLSAGAQAVCATRWKIPDEGGALVERMYAHLLQNTPRAEALRRAQIEMIDAADWRSEPRYWAAYFLVGEGSHRTVGSHRR